MDIGEPIEIIEVEETELDFAPEMAPAEVEPAEVEPEAPAVPEEAEVGAGARR